MDYMRKVIYLKKRENDALMQGQGFARLEKRENNLILYLSMHDITLPGENPVYIVCRRGEENRAYPVGTTVQSDTWSFRCLLEDLPEQMKLEEISGVLVGKKECYLSGTCPEYPEALLYGMVEFPVEGKAEREPEQEPETVQAADMQSGQESERKPEEIPAPEPESTPKAETEAVSEAERDSDRQAESEPEPAFKRDSFLKGLSEMYPFEDDEIEWCLQMRPEDFNQFPMEYWHYAKNSFLLQGFYNYRHLVYAHTKGKNYVGVPGQYIRKEQYLAARFGFTLFKQTRKKKLSMGDYGYWLREL